MSLSLLTEGYIIDAPPPIDLSVCRNVNSLTLSFHLLTNYGERHSRAVAYVNQTLSSLEHRPSDSTPLENLVLQIQTNYQEPKYHKLESWPLDVKSMRQMEDILLRLVEQRMCATVHVETNLQRWYSASGAIVYISAKGKDEHDARHMKYAEVCEKALRGVWARLDGKGLLTVATAPVRLKYVHVLLLFTVCSPVIDSVAIVQTSPAEIACKMSSI